MLLTTNNGCYSSKSWCILSTRCINMSWTGWARAQHYCAESNTIKKSEKKRRMLLRLNAGILRVSCLKQVLYSSWIELSEGMAAAGSLDEVIACHDAYLVSIQRQCLVAPDKLVRTNSFPRNPITICINARRDYIKRDGWCSHIPTCTVRCKDVVEKVLNPLPPSSHTKSLLVNHSGLSLQAAWRQYLASHSTTTPSRGLYAMASQPQT